MFLLAIPPTQNKGQVIVTTITELAQIAPLNDNQIEIKKAFQELFLQVLIGHWSMKLGKTVSKTLKNGTVKEESVYDIIIKHGQRCADPIVGALCWVRLARGGGDLFILQQCEKVGSVDNTAVSFWIGTKAISQD